MREMTDAACGPRCRNRLEGTQHLSCPGDTWFKSTDTH